MSDANSRIAQALMQQDTRPRGAIPEEDWYQMQFAPIKVRKGEWDWGVPGMIKQPWDALKRESDAARGIGPGVTQDQQLEDALTVAGVMMPGGLTRGGASKVAAEVAPPRIFSEAAPSLKRMRELLAAEKVGAELPDANSGAMRRAHAQGYDTSTMYYRGTTSDRLGDDLRVSDKHGAIYASPDPHVANEYAGAPASALDSATENGRVMPLLVRDKRVFDPQWPDHVEKLAKHLNMRPDQLKRKLHEEGTWSYLEQVQPELKAAGFRGYRTSENGDGNLNGIAMFDPADFRSPWAQFDPANAGKNGLLLEGSGPVAAIVNALRGGDRR